MKNEFQYRLQKSLAASGLTAAELSEKTGISEANISNYINGKYVAKQDKCFLLAQALEVDPGWLMTGDEPSAKMKMELRIFGEAKPATTQEARVISGGIDKMPKEKREQALKVLQAIFSEYFDGGENNDT